MGKHEWARYSVGEQVWVIGYGDNVWYRPYLDNVIILKQKKTWGYLVEREDETRSWIAERYLARADEIDARREDLRTHIEGRRKALVAFRFSGEDRIRVIVPRRHRGT